MWIGINGRKVLTSIEFQQFGAPSNLDEIFTAQFLTKYNRYIHGNRSAYTYGEPSKGEINFYSTWKRYTDKNDKMIFKRKIEVKICFLIQIS